MTSMMPEQITRRLLRSVLRLRGWRFVVGVAVILGYVALLPPIDTPQAPAAPLPTTGGQEVAAEPGIACNSPRIIDGDTFACGKLHIRLQGIDAPEMPGHCRPGRECTLGDPYKARNALIGLTRGEVTCKQTDVDTYGRTVARCWSGGVDLSCEMIAEGLAAHRYGAIKCQ